MTVQEQIVEMWNEGRFNERSPKLKKREDFYTKEALLLILDEVDTSDPETGKEFLRKFRDLNKKIKASKDMSRHYAYSKICDFVFECKRDSGLI